MNKKQASQYGEYCSSHKQPVCIIIHLPYIIHNVYISFCTSVYSNDTVTYACRNNNIAYNVSLFIPLSHGIIHGDAKGNIPKIGTKVQSFVGPPHVTRQRIQTGILAINPNTILASPHYDAIYKSVYNKRHRHMPCNEHSLLIGNWARKTMDGRAIAD